MSFLDSIVSDPADQDGEAPVLILPAKALNSVELSYRGAMAVEMASLKLPGLFVDDARINDEWRAVGCETAEQVYAYVAQQIAPIKAKYRDRILLARSFGPHLTQAEWDEITKGHRM